MEKILNVKGRLGDAQILDILSLCQYKPTVEKMRRLAGEYGGDPNVSAYALYDGQEPVGVIVLRRITSCSCEILGIATTPDHRAKGIGRKMVRHAVAQSGYAELLAETDDDAVDFYRKCGFVITSLGEKYPGIVRYSCTLKGEEG